MREYQRKENLNVVDEPQLDIRFSEKTSFITNIKTVNKAETLNVLSLFSGCGGMDLGFEGGFTVLTPSINEFLTPHFIDKKINDKFIRLKKTRFKTVFANDILIDARNAWVNHFSKNGHDAELFHTESIVDLVKLHKSGTSVFPRNIDVVTGGFPCQDFSIAGKRKGFDSHKSHENKIINIDTPSVESRGMLYYWLREAISIINPKIFIAENVKGMASMADVKKIITNDFRGINGGYFLLDPEVLHAANFGVPQSRERIFFIGIRMDLLNMELKEAILSNKILVYPKPNYCYLNGDFVKAIDYLKDLSEPEFSLDLSQQKYSNAKWYGKHCQGQTEINLLGLSPTIRSEHHGNIEFRRLAKENGGKIKAEYHLPQRRLTVRECARLQTFPDNYAFVTDSVSTSDAYKLVGNAVPPLLGYHLAMNVKNLLNIINKVTIKQKKVV